MRDADIANGENPDEATEQPAGVPAHTDPDDPDRAHNPDTESVPTGERQASENRENDPPA